jgi:uncharacterized protein YacL
MSHSSKKHEESYDSKLKIIWIWVIRLLPILPWLSYEIIAGIGQMAKNSKPATGVIDWFIKLIGHIVGIIITLLFSIPALIYEYLLQPIAFIYWSITIIYFIILLGWLSFKKPSIPTDN